MNTKEINRLGRRIALFLCVAIVGGLLTIIHGLHVRFDPGAERHYGRLVHYRIGGRDFAVPDEYVRGPRPTRGEQSKQLYIWMMLPDFTPYRGFDIEAKASDTPVAERHVMLLIDDTAFTTDLAFRYNAHRNGPENIFTPKDTRDIYGLHRSLIYRLPPRVPKQFVWSDLYYFQGVDKRVTTFIDCSRDDPNPHRYPQCGNHQFQDGRLLYNISYGKWNLPHWKEIETRVHDLIESFSCVSTNASDISTQKEGMKPCPL
jgi:hypothetical protein